MKKTLFLMITIVLLGFFLRFYNLTVWPREGATFDEYAWTWQGINLIEKGVPISWSPLPAYTNFQHITYRTVHFRIVKPYLEHPPLFGLVAGISSYLFGGKDMYHVTIQNIRPLALIMGTFSILLVFLLSLELFNQKTAFYAGLLYATIPTIAIGSRITQNENFLIPMWLLSVYCIAKFFHTKKSIWKIVGISFACVLIFAKLPWGAAPLSLVLIFLYYRKYKDALITLIASFGMLIALFLYGWYYDISLFVNLLLFQSVRYDLNFGSIFALFQKPYLVDRFYTDGWIYFGWFTVPLLFLSNLKSKIFIVAPLISYFIIYLAGIPDEAGHGWYRYPFYPFLAISIALFLTTHFKKNALFTFVFLSIVGSSLLNNTFGYVFGFSYTVYRVSILSWLIPLSSYFINIPWLRRLGNTLNVFWFFLFIILNVISIILYNEQ